MNPQPLLGFLQVKLDSRGRWGHWEPDWGTDWSESWQPPQPDSIQPLLNQPACCVGVSLVDGVWYWLIDS